MKKFKTKEAFVNLKEHSHKHVRMLWPLLSWSTITNNQSLQKGTWIVSLSDDSFLGVDTIFYSAEHKHSLSSILGTSSHLKIQGQQDATTSL